MQVTTLERVIRWHVSGFERLYRQKLPACSRVRGCIVDSTCSIIDLQGFRAANFTSDVRKVLRTIAQIDSDNYPESLGKMLIINAPVTFVSVWAIIKGFIDHHTRTKVEVMGHNYLRRVLEIVPEENFPVYLGAKAA